jgi:energy-coupling factor transport system substrate-specific component
MSTKKRSIKDDFSMLAILIIPVAVAVNFVGGQLASLLKLPCYLDAIGTIFGAMLCGPWVGAVIGMVTNIVTGIANPVNFAFIPVSVVVGLVTGFLSRKQMFSTWWKWIISMVLMALSSIIVAAPIIVYIYGGVTGGGTSIITATAMAAGANIWAAVIGSDGLFTVVDRIISFVISYLIIKVIPERTLIKFSCGENYIKGKK